MTLPYESATSGERAQYELGGADIPLTTALRAPTPEQAEAAGQERLLP